MKPVPLDRRRGGQRGAHQRQRVGAGSRGVRRGADQAVRRRGGQRPADPQAGLRGALGSSTTACLEPISERRDLLTRVVVAAAKANRELDEQTESFHQMRDLVFQRARAPRRPDPATVTVTARDRAVRTHSGQLGTSSPSRRWRRCRATSMRPGTMIELRRARDHRGRWPCRWRPGSPSPARSESGRRVRSVGIGTAGHHDARRRRQRGQRHPPRRGDCPRRSPTAAAGHQPGHRTACPDGLTHPNELSVANNAAVNGGGRRQPQRGGRPAGLHPADRGRRRTGSAAGAATEERSEAAERFAKGPSRAGAR